MVTRRPPGRFGRTKAYELVRAGRFPCKVIPAGRTYRVVTGDLRRVLGVQEEDTEHAASGLRVRHDFPPCCS
ncbi:hypothetical protein GCM10010313_81820 [Streptomyces violarus]|nr:hypothetical protein GCM10010313_81820 [Streptomyces violarus]